MKFTSAVAVKSMVLKVAVAVFSVAEASSGAALYVQVSVAPGATDTLVAPPPQSTVAPVPSFNASASETLMSPGEPDGFEMLILPLTAKFSSTELSLRLTVQVQDTGSPAKAPCDSGSTDFSTSQVWRSS